jgi:hypothetical protein
MKLPKSKTKQAHTSQTKMGMGDYYGTGFTGKIGSIRDDQITMPVKPKALKTPPKNLA